ncbi:MAG: component of SufBCD complex [Rhodobacterales bacterium 32-66-7]|nr:MAG: component of SufBCD complex [Rhodobacterales bacterium 12-65-15]OYX26856.1 MAG: component of SufBCD complex [Rhodobacterales bacterium 32-66-7]
MRSFSNLWYWIVLAVLWSSLSYFVLGVPLDMIRRGRREGGQAQADVEALIRITTARVLHMVDESVLVLTALGAFWMSGLTLLAFYYTIEFAQAVFLLLAPVALVAWFSIRLCRRIAAENIVGEALYRRLIVHRRIIQLIGMVAIFVTAMFGMWTNVNSSILG